MGTGPAANSGYDGWSQGGREQERRGEKRLDMMAELGPEHG